MYLGAEPDGYDEMLGVVMGPQGPRNIRQRVDYKTGVELEIKARGLAGELSDATFRTMLALMQENGFGAQRSQGYGQADVLSIEYTPGPVPARKIGKAKAEKRD